MKDKTNLKKSIAELSSGFSTGNALKLWLFFLFSFYFLGYPVPLSILLGAAGGISAGWVFGWWKTKDAPIDSREEEVDEPEDSPTAAKASGLRAAKLRRDAEKSRRRSQGSLMPLDRLWRR
jgi:hypothetical protein